MAATDRWDAELDSHIAWLMDGDAAIRWQTMRDLLGASPRRWQRERAKVATTGWGARLLELQDDAGTWAGGVYSPKWTSTTYTMLVLRELCFPDSNKAAVGAVRLMTDRLLGEAGSADFERRLPQLDYCVSGFIVSLLARFAPQDARLEGEE
jgi:hypothetical protein